ncbi:TPA: hypothetical protein HA251_02615 [Candidatus Woesearchaeota archaeon]|nr:hypothetical protein [Candidatus Woesearchaeota archaeon]
MEKHTKREYKHRIPLFIGIIVLLIIVTAWLVGDGTRKGHITLLTVVEGEEDEGGVADLYLTVRPGNGAIYLDSFPLTRIDTQSSIRYANQIACDFLDYDCAQYDFFYTIRANSAIVGGPSAGAAIATLTAAVLDEQHIDEDVAMTGTINSGGIIGPVAGIAAKTSGAREAGIKKAIIPALTSTDDLIIESTSVESTSAENGSKNETATDVETGLEYSGRVLSLSSDGFEVIGVATIEDAMYELTGKNYTRSLRPIVPPREYLTRMESVAEDICDRNSQLKEELRSKNIEYNDTNNYTARIAAIDRDSAEDQHNDLGIDDNAYTRASLCFSSNIELSKLEIRHDDDEDNKVLRETLISRAEELEMETRARNVSTIGDLETYAIVQERILEAKEVLRGAGDDDDNGSTDDVDTDSLGYARERLISAESWGAFFGMDGTSVPLDERHLRRACLAKLAEAEERVNYARLYAPDFVEDSDAMISQARALAGEEPILCIFAASKAKAQANILTSAITVGPHRVDELIAQKLAASDRSLRIQQSEGAFPITGYSYAQYARNLRSTQPYSALTFAEYSLELSTIDIYFPEERTWHIPPAIRTHSTPFVLGTIFGVCIGALIAIRSSRATKRVDDDRKRPARRRK